MIKLIQINLFYSLPGRRRPYLYGLIIAVSAYCCALNAIDCQTAIEALTSLSTTTP